MRKNGFPTHPITKTFLTKKYYFSLYSSPLLLDAAVPTPQERSSKEDLKAILPRFSSYTFGLPNFQLFVFLSCLPTIQSPLCFVCVCVCVVCVCVCVCVVRTTDNDTPFP